MTTTNRNSGQETGSVLGSERQKIELVATNFQGGRTERLERAEGRRARVCALEIAGARESNGSHDQSFFERLIVCGLSSKIHGARVRFSPGIHGLLGIVLAALVLGTAGYSASARAQVAEASPITTPTTVVVFADRPMQEEEWSYLFAALRAGLAAGTAETELLGEEAEFVRGDSVAAGFRVQTAIVVFLHGECSLVPLPRRTAYGVALGWVRRVNGQIEPFAHVDCTRIGQVLGPLALGMDADRRNAVMAGAMARVILHEWLHIASQDPDHAEHGIRRAQFGVADLLAGGR
jgi:hypothetical protein